MKMSGIVAVIGALQLVLLFTYITKEIALVRAGYRQQEREKTVAQLDEERSALSAQLHVLQKRGEVWEYVRSEWGMQKMQPKQLHKLGATPVQELVDHEPSVVGEQS